MTETSRVESTGLFARVHDLFNNRRLRKLLMKTRAVIGVAVFALLLYFARPDWFWIALATTMFGEVIQVWCFASLDKKGTLACNGLYKYVRNPMYLGRFFVVLGYVLLLKNIYFVPVLIVLYYFYMVNRVKREERILAEIFGEPYAEYCAQVNRFLPTRPAAAGTLWFWRWRLLFQNHGVLNLLAVALSYALLYWWIEYRPL